MDPIRKRWIVLSRAIFSVRPFPAIILSGLIVILLSACSDERRAEAPGRGPVEVTIQYIRAQDVPITFEFVGTTESSHQVEIRSRVEGFLEKNSYDEGGLVKAGQVMFRIDRRPFEANLQQAHGELEQQEAKLATAVANLARVRPLAEKNAVSKKDLDDAIGQEQTSRAAVLSARGKVRDAELKLDYTTIRSPITGYAGRAKKQMGSYISTGSDSLLTTVAKLDPLWVNFSISENENLKLRDLVAKGIVRRPPDGNFEVEISLADGTIFPNRGRVNFADPSYSHETGTFQVRAQIQNLRNLLAALRPGQFVRVFLKGAVRPNAIMAPRRAVMQGAKGHFVWVIDKDLKAEFRNVTLGSWHGESAFIESGLRAGDRLILDNLIKLAPGVPVKIIEPPPAEKAAQGEAVPKVPDAKTSGIGAGEKAQPAPATAAGTATEISPEKGKAEQEKRPSPSGNDRSSS